MLEEFDRGIFESIIEKVIVGGYDENGEKDPYKITFIYKTGFTNGIGNAKKRFGKSAGVGDKAKKMCSDVSDKVKDVYSNVSDNTCGGRGSARQMTDHVPGKSVYCLSICSASTQSRQRCALRRF